MNLSVLDILKVLGSLALFIYGMKVMSEGIQRVAGSEMRRILRSMTSRPAYGLFTGFVITALIQSSSATTVMTISFVNAGLMSLVESAGVLIGANIGTTITGWLIALGVSKINLSDLTLPIILIGVPMLFRRRGKIRFWGEVLIGFSLIFIALDFLKTNIPDLTANSASFSFLSEYTQLGYLSILIFIIIGLVITAIIQSSSAIIALTLVMCSNGWIAFETAAAMILGANIGTTITAELAALIANVHAKRAARIHTLFNLIGVAGIFFLMPVFLNGTDWISQRIFGLESAFESTAAIPVALAIFHTLFNLVNALILLPFAGLLTQLAKKTIRRADEEDDVFRLEYITANLKTPELSIPEVQKEIIRFGELASRMSGFVRRLLLSTDQRERDKLLERIEKYEEITDRVEVELSNYLTDLTKDEVSTGTSVKIRTMLQICSELERIGDVFYQMSKQIEVKIDQKIWFNQHQRDRMSDLFSLIDRAFEIMIANLSSPRYRQVSREPALQIEKQINLLRNDLRKETQATFGQSDNNPNGVIIYNNLFSSLEKIGDHIMSITDAVVGEV